MVPNLFVILFLCQDSCFRVRVDVASKSVQEVACFGTANFDHSAFESVPYLSPFLSSPCVLKPCATNDDLNLFFEES